MGSIHLHSKSHKSKTERFLKRMHKKDYRNLFELYALRGVEALSEATPKKTGLTAQSWDYEIIKENGNLKIIWTNSNVVDDWYQVAVMIQYGHGTGSGVYVKGVDYINPALKDTFDKIAEDIWREVQRS